MGIENCDRKIEMTRACPVGPSYYVSQDFQCLASAEKYEFERVETFGAVDENDLVAFSVSVDKASSLLLENFPICHDITAPRRLQCNCASTFINQL